MVKLIKFLIGQKRLNEIAFQSLKPKPKSFSDLQYEFIDSEGRKYYKYHDIFNCSLERKEQLTIKLTELNARASVEDLDQMFLLIKKSIDDGFKGSDYAGCVSRIAHVCEEWKIRREEIQIYSPAFIDVAALYYVRDDEQPDGFDVEIHNQKVLQFKKDYEGIKEFFFTQKLNQLLGLQEITPQELKQLYLVANQQLEQIQKVKKKYSLDLESLTSSKDSMNQLMQYVKDKQQKEKKS